MERRKAIEVKKGGWLYDNQVPKVVKIFCLNYDYYYDLSEADGLLGEDEQPSLNDKGEMYMIKWGDGDFFEHDNATIDVGGLDLVEAIKKAEATLVGDITWE